VYATVHYKSKEIKTTQWSAVKENVKTEKNTCNSSISARGIFLSNSSKYLANHIT